uniref:Uncharacterized protein n=1 Tax=Ascaris lumbricoides TaxID=6252 RepID=A0A0M3HUT1_ASCLU
MGERAFLSASLIQRFYPYRKLIVVASVLCILLAVLIIVENILVLASQQSRHPMIIIFPYLLAWFFVATGLVGLKMGFVAQNYVAVRSVTQIRRTGTSVWASHTGSALLAQPPGLVPTTAFQSPPPAYSQIDASPEAANASRSSVTSAPPAYELIVRVDFPRRPDG